MNISISEVQLNLLEVRIEVHQETVLAILEALCSGGPFRGLEVEARRSKFDLFLYVNPHLCLTRKYSHCDHVLHLRVGLNDAVDFRLTSLHKLVESNDLLARRQVGLDEVKSHTQGRVDNRRVKERIRVNNLHAISHKRTYITPPVPVTLLVGYLTR